MSQKARRATPTGTRVYLEVLKCDALETFGTPVSSCMVARVMIVLRGNNGYSSAHVQWLATLSSML